jgi:hypothetical protein
MDHYTLARLNEQYSSSGAYQRQTMTPKADYFVILPTDLYSSPFRRDVELLGESARVPAESTYADVASRVFGNQLRQGQFSLKHLANLLYERAFLYSRHIQDIDHRSMQVQHDLFCERLCSPQQATRRQIALETLIVQLEGDKRKEETDFWKDSKDVREVMLEKALEYQSTGSRAQLLGNLGGEDARD